MSTLADLIGAGEASPLPGYVLSPPRLLEYGRAEREFRRMYFEQVADGVRLLPPALQKELTLKVAEDLRAGVLTFGTPAFAAFALSAEGMAVLVWLSLEVKHPGIGLAKASELIDNDEGKIVNAVLDLWGYGPGGKAKKVEAGRINWEGILKRLTQPTEEGGHGLTHEQAGQLTTPQLLNLLASDKLSYREMDARREESLDAHFGRICQRSGLTPQQLAALPVDELIAHAKEDLPGKQIDEKGIGRLAKEYAARVAESD